MTPLKTPLKTPKGRSLEGGCDHCSHSTPHHTTPQRAADRPMEGRRGGDLQQFLDHTMGERGGL